MGFHNVGLNTLQITGALLVLVSFLLAQAGRINASAYHYLVPNVLGSAALTVTAIVSAQWGFVFLEAIWALLSAWGVVQRLRGIRPTGKH